MPANVREQIELLLGSFPVAAIKTGLLYSAEIVEVVATLLEDRAAENPAHRRSGHDCDERGRFAPAGSGRIYRARLFPCATLVTPNMAEAAALTGRPVRDLVEMKAAGNEVGAKIWDAFFGQGRPFGRRARDRSSV